MCPFVRRVAVADYVPSPDFSLVLRLRGAIQIFVQTLGGKTMPDSRIVTDLALYFRHHRQR